jgi:hypothetical protein
MERLISCLLPSVETVKPTSHCSNEPCNSSQSASVFHQSKTDKILGMQAAHSENGNQSLQSRAKMILVEGLYYAVGV